jgi:hypothetical protein
MKLSYACLTLILWCALCISSFAKDEAVPFSAWIGTWGGELKVYSATGEHLDTLQMVFSSEDPNGKSKGVQKISLISKNKKETTERQHGVYVMDGTGIRRIMKTEAGEPVSDLKGKILGPNKIYWFSIDGSGILREAYIESIEGDIARVNGFRWDGQRSGSYRIIEGSYERQKKI